MTGRRANFASRAGMTLLEVVLATVILAASLAVLGQLLNGARSASLRAALEVEAVQRAESAVAAAVLTLAGGAEVEGQTLEDGPWTVAVAAEAAGEGSLRRVTAVARHANEQGARDAEVELTRLALLAEAAE